MKQGKRLERNEGMEWFILGRVVMEVFSERMAFEQRPE